MFKLGAVNGVPRSAFRPNQTRVLERRKVEGSTGRSGFDHPSDVTGGSTVISAADQVSHDSQPGFLSERAKSGDGLGFVHGHYLNIY